MRVTGVLVRLDEPSTKAPNGSQGHRIMVPSKLAAAKLDTLIGMGLNYAPDLEGHARRRKVGVIERAWIDGKDLCIQGTVWKHDFPEAEKDLKQAGLGMSMEIGDVKVADENASIWELTNLCFTGATILWKNAAAYIKTRAIAAAREDKNMVTKKKTTGVAGDLTSEQIVEIAASAAAAVNGPIIKLLKRQGDIQAQQAVALDRLTLAFATRPVAAEEAIDAADMDETEDDEEAEACDMTTKKVKAAKKQVADEDDGEDDDDEDDDEIDSEAIDKGDLEEMGPETGDDEDGDDEPGQLSKGAKNKGSKTTSEDKVGKTESMGVTGSGVSAARVNALMKHVTKLSAKMDAMAQENFQLKKRLKKVNAQVEASAKDTTRRSVSVLDPKLKQLLEKSNIDTGFIAASGEKLSVADFDGILSGVQGLGIEQRIELKNRARNAGILEDGRVSR